jgi:hypothetical protein
MQATSRAEQSGNAPPRRRILLLSHLPHWPVKDAATYRTDRLVHALSTCGDVDVLIIAPPETCTPPEVQQLTAEHRLVDYFEWQTCKPHLPVGRYIRRRAPNVVRLLEEASHWRLDYRAQRPLELVLRNVLHQRRYDVIVSRGLRPAAVSSAALAGLPTIVDVGADTDRGIAEVFRPDLYAPPEPEASRHKRLSRLGARRLRATIDKHLGRCTHIWFADATERAAFKQLPSSILRNLPFAQPGQSEVSDHDISPPADCSKPDAASSREILIFGDLAASCVRTGVNRFLTRVWPRVLRQVPDAHLRIVGTGLTEEDRQHWGGHGAVEVPVQMPEPALAYRRAAFALALTASGDRNDGRVLSALAHGRTCVAHPYAASAVQQDLQHAQSLWIAADDWPFAHACIRLLRDTTLRQTMQRQGAQIVAQHFSYARFSQIVKQTIDAVAPLPIAD